MKRTTSLLFALWLVMTSSVQANAPSPDPLQVTEHHLGNGVTVWVNEDHSQPKVFGAIVVNAGARDCPGTGIAHMLEHLLFKGTEEMGTTDYACERPLLDSIGRCYDQLSRVDDASGRRILEQSIDRLSQSAARYAIPNEFNRLCTLYGGSSPNAHTTWDYTYYYDTFSGQYLEHWCQLNSERLLHPVFRLFESELATICEEKARYADDFQSLVREQMMQALFTDLPYGAPVIGSWEHLLHPQYSALRPFFDRYYVGCNMGLILSGDVDTLQLLPLLERSFGRIARGTPPHHPASPLLPIEQERTALLHLPLPLVDLELLAYEAPAAYSSDATALDLALSLLSDQQSGMLDTLCHTGHLQRAMTARQSLHDASVAYLLFIPPLLAPLQKAEQACLGQVRRLCAGQFSTSAFERHRLALYHDALRSLEHIDSRAHQMVRVLTSGHTWSTYLDRVRAIPTLTLAEVSSAARRYLDAPFVRMVKKEVPRLSLPLTLPHPTAVATGQPDAESAFARRMARLPSAAGCLRPIRFDRDATILPLGGQATLYTVANPLNPLYELTLTYNRGLRADRRLQAVAKWLNASLGSYLQATVTGDAFQMLLTGDDADLESTLRLVGRRLKALVPPAKSSTAPSDIAAEVPTHAVPQEKKEEDGATILEALLMRVMAGHRSPYLDRLTPSEENLLSTSDLSAAFSEVLRSGCHIVYSGSHTPQSTEEMVRRHLPIEQSAHTFVDYSLEPMAYAEPTVYVYDTPEAHQHHLFTYETIESVPTAKERATLTLLKNYFGSGMSSVLFQEMRERRALGYTISSHLYHRPPLLAPDSPSVLYHVADVAPEQTMNALALLDSLLQHLPISVQNYEAIRQVSINTLVLQSPNFRTLGQKIARWQWEGYSIDPQADMAAHMSNTSLEEMVEFYNKNIAHNQRHRVVGIVGDLRRLDMEALDRYGRVVLLGHSDLFKK